MRIYGDRGEPSDGLHLSAFEAGVPQLAWIGESDLLEHTLEQACREAASSAKEGEHIVLSPACASFDQFRDYTHRGAVFRDCFLAACARQGATR
jgi:hypothetical protein